MFLERYFGLVTAEVAPGVDESGIGFADKPAPDSCEPAPGLTIRTEVLQGFVKEHGDRWLALELARATHLVACVVDSLLQLCAHRLSPVTECDRLLQLRELLTNVSI